MQRWIVPILAAGLVVPAAQAQQGRPQGAAPAEAAKKGPYKDFAELTKDAAVYPGFFDFYLKEDKLYLAVPKARLGQDFLMEFKIAQGIGAQGLFGGTMLDIFEGKLVALERHGEQVFLVQRPHRFEATEGGAAQKAVDLTFGSSVLESAKIESIREDSAVVVEVTNWFISDISGVGERVRAAVATTPGQPGQATFERNRSYLESVKSFPRNSSIRVKLTFRPQRPTGLASVPDGRFIPVSIHTTFAALPDVPMKPRIGDDRVGNFLTVHKDFSQEDSTFFVRFVNRWRLEPGERVGDKVRPQNPITYYIDPNVPAEYRQGFKDGVEAWNAAFEAAGWVDAIRALDLPADADPEDIRYATLRWNVSDEPGYGAIGPSVVDPRSGEVLDADILFEANMFLNYRNSWRNLVNPVSAAEALEQALGMGEAELQWADRGGELASFAGSFEAQGALLSALLIERGAMKPGDPVPEAFMHEAVKWVTMHEVGHTLGLQHNFRSSASTPFARLHDRQWAAENGLFSSVMEYPTVNVAPRGTPNGNYYTPGIGSYDRWAISFAYTPDDARAAALARDVADKKHLYGTNAESGGPGALDPSINVYDLSDDPLAWGKERTAIIRGLWPSLPQNVLADNTAYYQLTQGFNQLMNQYAQAVAPAVKYIGGQYINRDHLGDPNGRLPFENVPKARQKEALDFVIASVFAPTAFDLPQSVLAQFGANRWFHWGTVNTYDGRLDYPFHEQVVGFQSALLNQLLHPFRLSRIRDGETKFGQANVVTIPELYDALTRAIWDESWSAPGKNTSAIRRDLQRVYVDAMTRLVVNSAARTPADARAVARLQLKELNRRITARLAPPASFDAYTRAHLEESKARIEKALEAGLELTN
jgi:hypothetical protein